MVSESFEFSDRRSSSSTQRISPWRNVSTFFQSARFLVEVFRIGTSEATSSLSNAISWSKAAWREEYHHQLAASNPAAAAPARMYLPIGFLRSTFLRGFAKSIKRSVVFGNCKAPSTGANLPTVCVVAATEMSARSAMVNGSSIFTGISVAWLNAWANGARESFVQTMS